MLKILQARLQQYVNCELPDVQAGFRKGRGNQRSNYQHPLYHRKRKRVPENKQQQQQQKKKTKKKKTSVSALWIMPKLLTVDHNKLENSSRDGNTRPPDLPLDKSVCKSGSNR